MAEDRTNPGRRMIALNVVVLKATSDTAAGAPIFYLAGGGVVPATRYAPFLATAFAELRRGRDIVLVDQRGTWNSNPLLCSPGDGGPPACLGAMSRYADPRFYGTSEAVQDLDEIRAALGYASINLVSVSYGTRVAQVYLRRFGQHVRSAVMHGVVPLGTSLQLGLARSAETVFDTVAARCARDASCRAESASLRADLDAVLAAATEDRPVRNWLQNAMSSAAGIRSIAPTLRSLRSGTSLASLQEPPQGPPPAPFGVLLTLLCGEDVALMDTSRITAAAAGTIFGDAPARFQVQRCASWPRLSLPDGFSEPVRSSVPVLVLSGELDPITPPAYGEAVTSRLGNARHHVLPGRSHQDADACVTSLMSQFLGSPSERPDASCLRLPPPR